jgi:transposase InsO family protein
MPYTSNPRMPRVRMEAVKLVRKGWSVRKVARHMGFSPGAISKWVQRAPDDARRTIPTRSSRPHHHPDELPLQIVDLIVELRLKRRRCSEVIHYELTKMGIQVSLSSVKRVLKRHHLLREESKWKKIHKSTPRPEVASPGDLVQLDTIHIHTFTGRRFYIYTLIDVFSRWAHAKVSKRITAGRSVQFLREAQASSPFSFHTLQSDHGSEFSQWFTQHAGLAHRHSRVRKPNNNAHLERFNRTIQEECLYYLKQDPKVYQEAIEEYLLFYNNERPHLSLNFLSPSQVFPSY